MKTVLISLCFVAVGIGMVYSGIHNLVLASRAASWPTVEGKIHSSRCVHYYGWDEGSSYLTHVQYGYVVGGQTYRGDRIAFGYWGSCWRSPNQKIADRLPAGATVQVRYDPEKPAMVVLSCGLNGSMVMTMAIGVWIIVTTALIARRVLRPSGESGTMAWSWGRSPRFQIVLHGIGGIVLAIVVGVIVMWLLGLTVDCGILRTLVTG